MNAKPIPTYPCSDCPVVRGEFCWTCPLPMEHLKVKPVCKFCGQPATTGITIPYRIEGDHGITYASFDTIPVCGSQDCLDEAEHVRAMTQ